MAVGQVTVLDIALEKLASGVIDLENDSFNVALCASGQEIDAAFDGSSNDARYADLTDEVSGAGYTAGGQALASASWDRTGGSVTFSADPNVWSGLDATVKYAVVYKDGGNDDILAFFDVDDASPTGRVIAGVDFTITWTGGLFTLSRAA